jgi:surface protein
MFDLGHESGASATTLPAFISVWNTANTSSGSSTSTQAKLPLISTGTYNFRVDWGDGSSSTITAYNQAEVTHTYASSGTYTLRIIGLIIGWRFNTVGDKLKLTEIKAWGPLKLGTVQGQYFFGCSNLTITATDILDLTGTTVLQDCFSGCSSLTTIPSANNWNTSKVTNMISMFNNCTNFNSDISNWNTSSVTSMYSMFNHATWFNQNIGSWNTSKVTDMRLMFATASRFNQSLNSWDVSKVTSMSEMFESAVAFNGNISSWNTGLVTDFTAMFYGASVFNQNIGGWNVSQGVWFDMMFQSATAFNQNIGSWSTANAQGMAAMFSVSGFNQNIGNWIIGAVGQMDEMFTNDTALSTANWDSILIGWASQFVQDYVSIATSTMHSSAANAAYTHLTSVHGWSISEPL